MACVLPDAATQSRPVRDVSTVSPLATTAPAAALPDDVGGAAPQPKAQALYAVTAVQRLVARFAADRDDVAVLLEYGGHGREFAEIAHDAYGQRDADAP